MTGIALIAEGIGSQRYLVVGVTGGEVANDHHPYYEFLFGLPETAPDPVLLSCIRFFYDVAGMEGLDGRVLWPAFFLVGMVAATVVAGVVCAIGVVKEKHSADVSDR